jgi:hypothetical protein
MGRAGIGRILFGRFSIPHLFVYTPMGERLEWPCSPRRVPPWCPIMGERVWNCWRRGHRYAQAAIPCTWRCPRLVNRPSERRTALPPAGEPSTKRGRSENARLLLQSDRSRRVGTEQIRREHWASAREREPAVFAGAGSYCGVVRRDIGTTGIGGATRATRRRGLLVGVCGRGGLVLRPRCAQRDRKIRSVRARDVVRVRDGLRTGSCDDLAPD